ncbi:hypothetical protein [Microbacterium algeriense]|uniref:hypothetical protein n=1 Tax=Microbacterium algeriense TaxID=2615184 RepID=UPI0002EA321B|nr:hypothetical protein [Microbacterium barkeri]
MKRAHAAIGLAIMGIALVGCTPAAEAPEVTWQSGPPSGEWESDPWVEAVRASDLALNTALVTRDYTSEELRSTTSSSAIKAFSSAQTSAAKGNRHFTSPGPTPMIPLDVEESDGEAIVRMCQAQDWVLTADKPTAPTELQGQVAEFRVVMRDGGERRSEGAALKLEECDLDGVSIGLFDPQPDPSETYSPDDVKEPS